MASLDISDPDIQKYIKLVQDGSEANRWIVFSYVPRSNNKIKFCDSGSGDLKELREELDDSSIRFAYIRYSINNMQKFVYIPWCGDGVNGPIKGAFSGHAIEFSKMFKPIHHQVNARSEEDIDEKAIIAALNKATGASYDSGSKVQGTTKTFVPTSVSQGREAATKSNAEVKNVINKNDYNKVQESSEYWKQNQAVKADPAKPARTEYNLSTERDDYWKQQQAEKQQQQAEKLQQQQARNVPAPTRTVGNKFQEVVSKPTETVPQVPRPAPSKGNVLNRFPAATQEHPAPVPSRPAAPVPSRNVKPAYQEPEPVYEEQQQQQYEEQQPEQYYEEQQPVEEQQQYYEEQQQEQYYEEQQPVEEQQYYEEQQPVEEQQYYEEQQQEQYYEEQQPVEEQQYYDEQPVEQQYGIQAKALYDYIGENEGDLSFKEGDIIDVLNQSDPDGWWEGSLPTGEQGFFPSNFVALN